MVPPVASTTTCGRSLFVWAVSAMGRIDTAAISVMHARSRRETTRRGDTATLRFTSARDEHEPCRADDEVDDRARGGRDRPEAIKLALGQVAAAGEKQVRARALRGDDGEVVRGEQELKREHRRVDAQLHADAKEDAE